MALHLFPAGIFTTSSSTFGKKRKKKIRRVRTGLLSQQVYLLRGTAHDTMNETLQRKITFQQTARHVEIPYVKVSLYQIALQQNVLGPSRRPRHLEIAPQNLCYSYSGAIPVSSCIIWSMPMSRVWKLRYFPFPNDLFPLLSCNYAFPSFYAL